MKIVQINTVVYGSTGRIMMDLVSLSRERGWEAYVTVPKGRHYRPIDPAIALPIGSRVSEDLHLILGRITGLQGFFSRAATRRFLRKLDAIGPDLIHLHNLHNSYINLPMLFAYLKAHEEIRVVWTFHDCWPITGHCPHFDMIGCGQWEGSCGRCPQYREYPQSWVDHARLMHRKKKQWFGGVKNLTVVTPSKWVGEMAGRSFMGQYPIQVIHNGVNLSVFQPTDGSFRQDHGLEGKHIVLGVAFGWGLRKGLDVFIELAHRLDDTYRIVLVGTDERVDAQLPESILAIHRTQNQKQLAEIYTAADVFVNPTREETLGLVNIEALACGTPVITFRSGGSPECIDDTCGTVVEKNDVDGMEREIRRICTESPYPPEACRAYSEGFEINNVYKDYMDLYERTAE